MTQIVGRASSVLASLALVAVLLAGCTSGGAAPSASVFPGGSPDIGSAPTPVPGSSTASPGLPGGGGADGPASGGGSSPNPATGSGGAPGFADPGQPAPTIVTPGSGLSGVHPVGATSIETAVNGRDLAVRVAWWSGVEPCTVLSGVDVAQDGSTFTLTVREGSAAPPDTACIDIAQYKASIVDLGELEPGTYTIAAFGDAAPVTVTID